jgi:hypothetical protein
MITSLIKILGFVAVLFLVGGLFWWFGLTLIQAMAGFFATARSIVIFFFKGLVAPILVVFIIFKAGVGTYNWLTTDKHPTQTTLSKIEKFSKGVDKSAARWDKEYTPTIGNGINSVSEGFKKFDEETAPKIKEKIESTKDKLQKSEKKASNKN